MKASSWSEFFLPIAVFLLACQQWPVIVADIFEECTPDKQNQFVASATSCRGYIFCDGDGSYSGECGDGDYFNELFQTCDPADIVDCRLDDAATTAATTATTTAATTATTTTTTTTTTTAMPITTTTTSSSSTSSTTMPKPPSTSAATTSRPQTPLTQAPSILQTACPERDEPGKLVFLAHNSSCSAYYLCFHGEPIEMHCSAMLHFDVHTGKCDYPEHVKCNLDHLRPKQQCQAHTVDLFPHPSNCNYYYYCRYGYLMLQQCPFYFGWDYERRTCIWLRDAKCYRNQKVFN